MSLPLFPIPEPPADVVAQVLDELREARRELDHARGLVRMLKVDPGAQPRHAIETDVAERRVIAWQAVVEQREEKARLLGLDVRSTL